MIVTSLSALAVSVRSTLARARSNTATPSRSASATRVSAPADSINLSPDAVRLVKALDPDGGDGLGARDQSSEGAIELLKRASIRFHSQRIARLQPRRPR